MKELSISNSRNSSKSPNANKSDVETISEQSSNSLRNLAVKRMSSKMSFKHSKSLVKIKKSKKKKK